MKKFPSISVLVIAALLLFAIPSLAFAQAQAPTGQPTAQPTGQQTAQPGAQPTASPAVQQTAQPTQPTSQQSGSQPTTQAAGSCGTTYTVKTGDSLSSIAQACGVIFSDLVAANTSISDPNLIFPGQVINVPQGAGIPTTGGASTYTVVAGDTLSQIAGRFNTTVQALVDANPSITDPNLIIVAQALTLPQGSSVPATGGSNTGGANTGSGSATSGSATSGSATSGSATGSPSPTSTSNASGTPTASSNAGATPTGSSASVGSSSSTIPNTGSSNTGGSSVGNTGNSGSNNAGPTTGGTVYTVVSGDTLTLIAQRFNTTVQALISANPFITDPNLIVPGWRLNIP